MNFTRLLETGDPYDTPFYDGQTVRVLFAHGADNLFPGKSYHGQNRNSINLVLFSSNADKTMYISSPVAKAVVSVAIIELILLVAVFAIVTWRREHPAIKATSYIFTSLMIAGTAICVGYVFLLIGAPSVATCGARTWILPLGFSLIFGSILVRQFRLYRIFKSLFAVKLPDSVMLGYLSGIVGVNVVILIAAAATGNIQPTTLQLDTKSIAYDCISNSASTINIILYVYNAFLLLIGAILAYINRSVHSSFNESAPLGMTVYNTVAIVILVALL